MIQMKGLLGMKDFIIRNLSKEQINFLRCIYGKYRDIYRKHSNPEKVLKKMFKTNIGYELDLNNPKTFNEKLQWLKLYNHNDVYTTMVDKYAVKEYVADKIGKKYIIPTLGVWNHFDEIDFNKLPKRFVLKCTHDCGSVILVKDKYFLDKAATKNKLESALRHNYYYSCYEWPYKNVPPKIIAETFMIDVNNTKTLDDDLTDYKFMCFHGEVKCIFTCTQRRSVDGLHVTFFDRDWNQLPFERHYPAAELGTIPKPKNLELMKALAERLSEHIPFVRVDFYEINGMVYFGELTFFPGAGFEEFSPVKYDYLLGSWIKLPDK